MRNLCPNCFRCGKRIDDANHPKDVDNKCCVCLRAGHRARYCRTTTNLNPGKYCVHCKIDGSHTYPECRKRLYSPQNNVIITSEQNDLNKYFLENDYWEDYVNAQIEEQNDEEESNSEDNSSDSDEQ